MKLYGDKEKGTKQFKKVSTSKKAKKVGEVKKLGEELDDYFMKQIY